MGLKFVTQQIVMDFAYFFFYRNKAANTFLFNFTKHWNNHTTTMTMSGSSTKIRRNFRYFTSVVQFTDNISCRSFYILGMRRSPKVCVCGNILICRTGIVHSAFNCMKLKCVYAIMCILWSISVEIALTWSRLIVHWQNAIQTMFLFVLMFVSFVVYGTGGVMIVYPSCDIASTQQHQLLQTIRLHQVSEKISHECIKYMDF